MPTHRDFLLWLIVIAEESAIKPLADVIGNYTRNNRFYKSVFYAYPLLSVARLPEWSGDNIVMVAYLSSTFQ